MFTLPIITSVLNANKYFNEENSYLIKDYPYGSMRCQRKVWLETKKNKGTRWMAQTQNPKNGRWNKPHASTYADISGALYLDENNYIQWAQCHWAMDAKECRLFLDTFGENATNYSSLLVHVKQKEKMEIELARRGNPSYGTKEFHEAYKASMK